MACVPCPTGRSSRRLPRRVLPSAFAVDEYLALRAGCGRTPTPGFVWRRLTQVYLCCCHQVSAPARILFPCCLSWRCRRSTHPRWRKADRRSVIRRRSTPAFVVGGTTIQNVPFTGHFKSHNVHRYPQINVRTRSASRCTPIPTTVPHTTHPRSFLQLHRQQQAQASPPPSRTPSHRVGLCNAAADRRARIVSIAIVTSAAVSRPRVLPPRVGPRSHPQQPRPARPAARHARPSLSLRLIAARCDQGHSTSRCVLTKCVGIEKIRLLLPPVSGHHPEQLSSDGT